MNDDFFKQQPPASARGRADPFTRKRLLDLAERYEGGQAVAGDGKPIGPFAGQDTQSPEAA
jgi:hypothetical protein